MPSHNITSQSQPQCVYRFKPDHQPASAANSQTSGFARSSHLSSHQALAHTIKFCKPVRSVRFIAQDVGAPGTQSPAIDTDNTDIKASCRMPGNSLIKQHISTYNTPEGRTHNFISYGHLLASPLAPAPTIEFREPVRRRRGGIAAVAVCPGGAIGHQVEGEDLQAVACGTLGEWLELRDPVALRVEDRGTMGAVLCDAVRVQRTVRATEGILKLSGRPALHTPHRSSTLPRAPVPSTRSDTPMYFPEMNVASVSSSFRALRREIGVTPFLFRAFWPGPCRASSVPLVCVLSPVAACSFPCLSSHPCLPCVLLLRQLCLKLWITSPSITHRGREPTLPQKQNGKLL